MTAKQRLWLYLGSARRALSRGLTGSDRVSTRLAARNDFRQVEDLLALHVLLQPTQPVPRMRGWAASPDVLRSLAQRILDDPPEVIVEFGSGTSTIVMALAAKRAGHGHVFSYDHEPTYAEQTRRTLDAHGLADWATVTDAPLVPITDSKLLVDGGPSTWYAIRELPDSIGLVFVDGPPHDSAELARYPSLPAVASHLVGGSTLLLDDADRPQERSSVGLWQARFPHANFSNLATEKGTAVVTWPV